mmetsp:Transcript_8238/g.17868  ORF Transcript_8238/g.17868 Transcript_8238/m.17868 type:complete len:227 (+) Transcript_8238:739-1419(+)
MPHAIVDLEDHIPPTFCCGLGHMHAVTHNGLRATHRNVQRRHVAASKLRRHRKIWRCNGVGLQPLVASDVLHRICRECVRIVGRDILKQDVSGVHLKRRQIFELAGTLYLRKCIGVVFRRVAHQVCPRAKEECPSNASPGQELRLRLQLEHKGERRATARGITADEERRLLLPPAGLLWAVLCEPTQRLYRPLHYSGVVACWHQWVVGEHDDGSSDLRDLGRQLSI